MINLELRKLKWSDCTYHLTNGDNHLETKEKFVFLNQPSDEDLSFYSNHGLITDHKFKLCENTTSNFLSSIIYFHLIKTKPSLFDIEQSQCYPMIELKKGVVVKKYISDENNLRDYTQEWILTKSAVENHVGLSFQGLVFNMSRKYGHNPRLINERVFDKDVNGYKASHVLLNSSKSEFPERAKKAHNEILLDLLFSSLNFKQKLLLTYKRIFTTYYDIFEPLYSFNIPILPILLQAIDDIVLPAHGHDFKIDRSKFQAIKRI